MLSTEIEFKLGFPIQSGNGPNVFPLIIEKYKVTLRLFCLLRLIKASDCCQSKFFFSGSTKFQNRYRLFLPTPVDEACV